MIQNPSLATLYLKLSDEYLCGINVPSQAGRLAFAGVLQYYLIIYIYNILIIYILIYILIFSYFIHCFINDHTIRAEVQSNYCQIQLKKTILNIFGMFSK